MEMIAQCGDEPFPGTVVDARRPGEIERKLDSGCAPVGVLTPRASGRVEAPLQLRSGDNERSSHREIIHFATINGTSAAT